MATSRQSGSTGFHRTLLAIVTALVAVAICLSRGHVHVTLGDSSTYASPFEHRCGQLMVACIAWAAIEVAFYLLPASRVA